jgi:magnesium transporter
MSRRFKHMPRRVAQPPGTMLYLGERHVDQARIDLVEYDQDRHRERQGISIEEAMACRDSPPISWLNVTGLHDTELIERLGNHFGLHPLVLEDIVNIHQRPKLEDYEDYLYIVVKMLSFDRETRKISAEQVSFVLTRQAVLSFQEREGDVFEPVRERIRQAKGRIRRVGADYLMYALLDAIVDHLFVVLEKVGDLLEELEDELVESPRGELLQMIHGLRREMVVLRKSVWPLREIALGLEREEGDLIQTGTIVFLRDVYDHAVQVIDSVESFRDLLSGLQDLYLSSLSNRLNQIMKVLTVIGTMFIPLSFLTGVYGMNFDWLPELHWKWSYPIFWVVVLGVLGGMVTVFKRKDWL